MTLELLILLTGFPFLVPVVASGILWRTLDRQWLFLTVSLLSVVAISDVSLSILRDCLVSATPDPLPTDLLRFNIDIANQNHLAMLLTDVVVLIVGVPLLKWLHAALRKSPRTVAARFG